MRMITGILYNYSESEKLCRYESIYLYNNFLFVKKHMFWISFLSEPSISLQILDFGLARIASNGVQTGYVATRYVPHLYFILKIK